MLLCPRCNETEMLEPIEKNAVSNEDKKTWICISCGRMENVILFFIAKGLRSKIPEREFILEKKFKERLGID